MGTRRRSSFEQAEAFARDTLTDIGPYAAKAIFRVSRAPPPQLENASAQATSNLLVHRVESALARYIQLFRIIEDAEKCRAMARRYPWRGTGITRADHFYFVWFNFTNQCYLYKERTKTFLNDMNALRKFFGEPTTNVGNGLKKVETALGEYIRHRGSHVHGWHDDHWTYAHFGMIEHLVASGDTRFADDYKNHYQDTKWDMRWRMRVAVETMAKLYVELEGAPHTELKMYLQRLDRFLEVSNATFPPPEPRKRPKWLTK